jgi:hypothetical protein
MSGSAKNFSEARHIGEQNVPTALSSLGGDYTVGDPAIDFAIAWTRFAENAVDLAQKVRQENASVV